MGTEWMGLDAGAWADWAGALAGFASAGFGIAALRMARAANDLAAQVAREETERERRRDQRAAEREEQRDQKEAAREDRARRLEAADRERAAAREKREDDLHRRSLAASLQAWWAKTEGGAWGVVVMNAGAGASVFHDVTIEVTGTTISRPISIPHLPPGRYFVQSAGKSWPFPEPLQELKGLTPITGGATHSVERISFRDALGQSWVWSPAGGLVLSK